MSGNSLGKSDIMIVDDNPANLKLLQEMLAIQGHRVRSFPLGRLALAAAIKNPPDLVLMDVNMPEMDGYETCGRLKANAAIADIPVIFLSALDETPDKVKAFHAGAADYITKPFQIEEVHSRVETHLQLYNLQRALKQHNEYLELAVSARTKELAEANARLRILDQSKTEFLKVISHEFRTPLNGLLGVSEIMLDKLSDDPQDAELKQIYGRSRNRILAILEDALLLGEIDVGALRYDNSTVRLLPAIESVVEQTRPFAQSRNVGLSLVPPESPPWRGDAVVGDSVWLARAIQGLLETAVKFARAGTTAQIVLERSPQALSMVIESQGFTIPPKALGRFFDILAIGEAMTLGGDLGLRPAVAQRLLSLFQASASVANQGDSGIRLTVAFTPAG